MGRSHAPGKIRDVVRRRDGRLLGPSGAADLAPDSLTESVAGAGNESEAMHR